jgi:uncharacterized protein
MEKVRLKIAGIAYSSAQSGSYVLTLIETGGRRELPIVIGAFEAQSIAVELEKMTPNRPLTHDLFKILCQNFDINIVEVIIYKFQEGVFYSKIICEHLGKFSEIDSRTSDAVAIGMRIPIPIYTYDTILQEVGGSTGLIFPANQEMDDDDDLVSVSDNKEPFSSFNLEELNFKLAEALENEDYELASKIRDEIQKRSA